MVRKTKFWVILFSALFVLSLGAFLILWGVRGTGAVTARIWLDEEIVEEINLSTVAVPYEFDVATELGTNRVRVEHGGISVVSADCPDQTCVRMGRISGSFQPDRNLIFKSWLWQKNFPTARVRISLSSTVMTVPVSCSSVKI